MVTAEKFYYVSQLLALVGARYVYEFYVEYFTIGVPLASASLLGIGRGYAPGK